MQVSFGIDGNQKCTSGTGLLRRESGRDRINETAVFQEDAIKSMMLTGMQSTCGAALRAFSYGPVGDVMRCSKQQYTYCSKLLPLAFTKATVMVYHLETFATWLREDMKISDDAEIFIDRAAIPKDRKKILSTRWDTLAKQNSFTMPKVPSRRRLSDTIEEGTATVNDPLPTRMIRQTSPPRGGPGRRLGGDGGEGAVRPGRGMVKQRSLSSLPPRRTNCNFPMVKQNSLSSLPRQSGFDSLTKDEQMKMPRLVKQTSFSSLQRRRCDENQSIGSMPCMKKKTDFSLPNLPSRTEKSCVSSAGIEPNDHSFC
jgi:hypothetical protein